MKLLVFLIWRRASELLEYILNRNIMLAYLAEESNGFSISVTVIEASNFKCFIIKALGLNN